MIDKQHYTKPFSDILSLRDLSDSTIRNYLSYLNQFLVFLDTFYNGILPEDTNWNQIRSSADFFTSRKSISYHPVMANISKFFTVPFAPLLARP